MLCPLRALDGAAGHSEQGTRDGVCPPPDPAGVSMLPHSPCLSPPKCLAKIRSSRLHRNSITLCSPVLPAPAGPGPCAVAGAVLTSVCPTWDRPLLPFLVQNAAASPESGRDGVSGWRDLPASGFTSRQIAFRRVEPADLPQVA